MRILPNNMSTVLRRQMLSDFKTVREGDILTPENRKFFDKIMTATVTGGDKLKAGLPQERFSGIRQARLRERPKE